MHLVKTGFCLEAGPRMIQGLSGEHIAKVLA